MPLVPKGLTMSRHRLLVLGAGLLAPLLVFVGVALYSDKGGAESKSSDGTSSVISPEHLRDNAAGSIESLDNSQHRGLFGWGGKVGGSGSERKARLAFLILSSGDDVGKLELLLPEIYDQDNIYLVHVDAKAPPEQVCLQCGAYGMPE